MRKRLIEKFTKAKEGSLGYTLTELLVVIAIIAIVVAIAIPSVIAISRALKFKRLNDHAKSIFLAAQQNLTDMRSDGGLKLLQSAEGAGMIPGYTDFPDEYRSEYVYTYTGTRAFDLILPPGSVEGTVRAEQIIIEYNPLTGNVYAVFYSEDIDVLVTEYANESNQKSLPRDKAARKDMMLGYYDGSGLNSSQLELEKTRATVEFVNGEEGIVRVLVPVPDDFFSNVNDYAKALEIDLTITGEYSMLKGVQTAAETGTEATDPSTSSGGAASVPAFTVNIKLPGEGYGLSERCYVENGNTIVVEYPIDSLMDKGSFANYAAENRGSALTNVMDESAFKVLPGENITIQADVKMHPGSGEIAVEIEPGLLSGVNPMFEYLQPSGEDGYILAVSNGRNLQNLNAIAPEIAQQVKSVVFTSDIYWNKTVAYYNDVYGNGDDAFSNQADEAPARALPYFVPIHNENLFGTAKFIFPGDGDGGLGGVLEDLREFFDKIGEVIFGGFNNPKVPTLTDEMDAVNDVVHASIQGNGHKVYNLNIDSNAYAVPHDVEDVETATDAELAKLGKFYAVGENQVVDYYFTGLFGYVNTPIEDLHVVNPIIKGHAFDDDASPVYEQTRVWNSEKWTWEWVSELVGYAYQYNNPSTGALVGACGYNTVITNCSTYIDRDPASGFIDAYLTHGDFSVGAPQKWYGVSGEGAVGGLVGYAKSHRAVNGELTNNKDHLAFSNSFAAVAVSGNMRKLSDASTDASGNTNSYGKDFGYSNGVGAFIGNSQLTNFYNCYASGDVKATNSVLCNTILGDIGGKVFSWIDGTGIKLEDLYGGDLPDLLYNGRSSWGAGGFVGSSHGTCYTNCFATGDVTSSSNVAGRGAGGFVGIMSIDETSAYGNTVHGSQQIAQRTIFSSCYAVGLTSAGATNENFSGGNGRIVYDPDESFTAFIGDYYRLYAVYYDTYRTAPQYNNSTYYYRDTYYLTYGRYTGDANDATRCGESEGYETLQNLPGAHSLRSGWAQGQVQWVKSIPTVKRHGFLNWSYNYNDAYFKVYGDLENLYYVAYDQGYSPNAWESPADGDAYTGKTYPYTLSAGGAVYPFSKLKGLDYYGDWPAKPSGMGMAYYEIYNGEDENIHYVFDKERDTDTRLSLTKEENDVVTKDGFAIFSVSKQSLTVTVGNKTFANLTATTDEFFIEGKKYYAFLLPDEALNVKPAQGEFYVQVTAKHATGDTFTMFFNPDVALSHANPSNGAIAITKPTAAPKTIYVRSARQFKALSTLQNYWTEDYRYIQQLNIDAAQYDGWVDTDRKIASIGNEKKKFNASYTAGYTNDLGVAKQHSISGFQLADNASGFFGVIGDKGTVEELIVNGNKLTVGGATVSDAAVLAGRNEGVISNVDLVLTGDTSVTAKTNAGLLAGYNSGVVRGCEVTAAAVTLKAENCGGLIGSAVGTEQEQAAISKSSLALTGKLSIAGAKNAGGLIGYAENLNLAAGEPLVTLAAVEADATYAGGLAGFAKDTEIKITDAENEVTVTADSIANENGFAAGALGGGENVIVNGVDVTVKTVSGNVAAGFLGTGTNVDASFCDVVVESAITGTEKAAGMAGTIGSQSQFNLSTVTLTKVTVKANEGDAAGYAVEIAKEADVQNSSVTLGGSAKIEAANGNAAGYTCTLAGYVGSTSGSTVICSVVGRGTITGKNAAGFACDITGQVATSFVTPALTATKDAYKGNSNDNLQVIAAEAAAGFALNVGEKATVNNCYALNKLTGKNVSGFAQTNKGTINGCMANVTLNGGYAFVEKNEGIVSRSYGWYGDGVDATTTVAEVEGKFYSCYFADLNPADKEGKIVVLYTPKGEKQNLTAAELQGSIETLAGEGYIWHAPSTAEDGYASYPYADLPDSVSHYLYPMLRDHYGDWLMPPQYAYGVAYYEIYQTTAAASETTEGTGATEGTTSAPTTGTQIKLHMVDLSDSKITEEGAPVTAWLVVENGIVSAQDKNKTVFDNSGVITEAGYAVFGKEGSNILSGISGETEKFSFELTTNDETVTYAFFPLTAEGVVNIGTTAVSKNTATVQTWFADAINVTDNTYQVRTPAQLANVAQSAAASFNFNQTHDITVTDFTTVANLNGTYDGKGSTLRVNAQATTWLTSVGDTVQNLKLEIPNGVNAPIFGTVSQGANVTLSGLKIGAVGEQGALANAVSGSMTVPAISTSAVNGKLFGDSTGTINTGAITVTGAVTQLFGDVGNVTVDGAIETGVVSGKLFNNVSGTVSTGAINVTGTAAQVFGNVNANTDKNNKVTVNGAITLVGTGKVFGTVGAEVQVTGLIKTGDLTGNAIGAVNAKMTLNGIEAGDVPSGNYVIAAFGNGVNEVKTGDVTVTKDVSGNVFGAVNGTVTVGAVSTQAVANIFGDVTGGSLTVASVNTDGNDVSGNVFGNVSANLTVTNGITTSDGEETPSYGAVNGQVFGAIEMGAGEAVQVGGITVGNVTNTLIKSITTAAKTDTAAAGSVSLGAVSTLEIGTPAQGETAAVSVDLFGEISGSGTVTVASINTNGNAVTGNVFTKVGGSLTVTNGITTGAVTGNVFTEITGGTVTTGAINVASLNGKLATSVGGTLQGSAVGTAVNIGENGTADLTQDLVGNVSGSLKNYAVKATNVSASVVGTLGENGTVEGVSVTAASAGKAPVLVKSNGGNIVSCTVEVVSVNAIGAAAPYGVMADKVNTNKKIENSFVKVGTLTIDGNTAQFGALVGTNAGSLTGNTVDSNEADKSLALNVNGVNGKAPVIGGLVAQNTGTVFGGIVDVAITYAQINDKDAEGNVTATDKGATIGGLVGENSGTIGADTITTVKGAVNLTKLNDGLSRAYIIGGAVGNAQSGATNTTANVKVGAEWAGSLNKEGSATFGSSGITNNGPVGMFVGFAGGVTFKDCHSTAENSTYQFVGEATLTDLTETNGLWYSATKSETALTAYSDDDKISDTSYNAKAGSVTAVMNANAASCKKVTTEFDNCTFLMGTDQKRQTYGVGEYYYKQTSVKENAYSIATNAVAPSISNPTSKTYYVRSFTAGADPVPTEFYYFSNDRYYPVSVRYSETTKQEWWGTSTTKTFALVETGNETNVLVSKTAGTTWENWQEHATFSDLYTLTIPELNSTYVAVKENGTMVDSAGTEYELKNFEQRDDERACLWTVSGSNIENVENKASFAMTAAISTGDSPVMVYTASDITFNLYPVTVEEGASAYDALTFTYQTDAEYQRQFVTSENNT